MPSTTDSAAPDQRIVEAAVHLVSYGAVTGWAGLTVSEERLLPADVIVVDGLRVTTPARSVLLEMRNALGELGASTALDMACFSDLVSLEEATAYAATLGTWTGIPLARGALGPADEDAWSPTEVATRVIWTPRAGLPRPLTNVGSSTGLVGTW